jgi:hypothetical protein
MPPHRLEQQRVETVDGHQLTARDFVLLQERERLAAAARPWRVAVGSEPHWPTPLLLLTDRRLVVSKDRRIGRRRADFEAEWSAVSSVSEPLWNGGQGIQLLLYASSTLLELILQPRYAAVIESVIRAGYNPYE